MATRRRNVHSRPKEHGRPEAARTRVGPDSVYNSDSGAPAADNGPPGREGYLPVSVVMEILAGEYRGCAQGEALCRAALRLAEEGGVLDNYRAKWDAGEAGPPALLYDRRQSLELVRYYEKKEGSHAALSKEREKLRQIEGRLLLDRTSPAKLTEVDLEELERYIRENGF